MNAKRQGEIALMLVKRDFYDDGIGRGDMNRKLHETAAKLNISHEEMREFYETIVPEILAMWLNRESVQLVTK